VASEALPAYSPFRCGDLGFAYNEAAFRHFLGIERRRAARSSRAVLVILVRARIYRGGRPSLDARAASHVFKALGACIREVDFVGWHREGKVAGAVVAMNGSAGVDVVARLASRVVRMLDTEMGAQGARLRVQVVRLAPGVRN
jgi:hypothetical protein